jgi:hypothetical protein
MPVTSDVSRAFSQDQAGQVGDVPGQQLDVGHDGADELGLRVVLAADEAVDLVALRQQQLGQVQPVLTGDAGDECALHVVLRSPEPELRATLAGAAHRGSAAGVVPAA